MPEATEDLITRIHLFVDTWDSQILQSHDALAAQLREAQNHLERLYTPPTPTAEVSTTDLEAARNHIEILEARVAQLNDELQRAHSAEPPMVGGPPRSTVVHASVVPAESDAIPAQALAQAEETIATLQQALETRDDALSDLKVELASLNAILETTTEKAREEKAAEDDIHRQALESATAQWEAAALRIEELEKQLTDLDTLSQERDALRQQNQEVEEALDAARAEVEATAERCMSLEDQLNAAEANARQEPTDHAVADTTESDAVIALQLALETLQYDHTNALARIQELEAMPPRLDELSDRSARNVDGSIDIRAFDAEGHKKRMGEILLELGMLDEAQLKAILKEQNSDPQRRLGALVVEHGYTGEDVVAKILAAQLRLPYEDIRDTDIEADAVARVSPHVCRLHHCMPLKELNGVLLVAMVNPLDLIAIEDLELASHRRVSPVVATRAQIDARLEEYYGNSV